jgi:hypothetical protein
VPERFGSHLNHWDAFRHTMGIPPEIQPTLLILENGMRQDLQEQQDK